MFTSERRMVLLRSASLQRVSSHRAARGFAGVFSFGFIADTTCWRADGVVRVCVVSSYGPHAHYYTCTAFLSNRRSCCCATTSVSVRHGRMERVHHIFFVRAFLEFLFLSFFVAFIVDTFASSWHLGVALLHAATGYFCEDKK